MNFGTTEELAIISVRTTCILIPTVIYRSLVQGSADEKEFKSQVCSREGTEIAGSTAHHIMYSVKRV